LSNHLPLGGLLLARKIFSSSSSSDFSPTAQIALLTGFNHRKRKVSDIDDLRLFLFHNLIFMLKYPRGNAILTFTYRRASKSLKTISVREIFCNIWTDARMTLQLSLKT
jgi:hypothetical protein